MPLSANFSTLKEQVETADQRIRASAAQGAAELKAMVGEARTKADAAWAPARGAQRYLRSGYPMAGSATMPPSVASRW